MPASRPSRGRHRDKAKQQVDGVLGLVYSSATAAPGELAASPAPRRYKPITVKRRHGITVSMGTKGGALIATLLGISTLGATTIAATSALDDTSNSRGVLGLYAAPGAASTNRNTAAESSHRGRADERMAGLFLRGGGPGPTAAHDIYWDHESEGGNEVAMIEGERAGNGEGLRYHRLDVNRGNGPVLNLDPHGWRTTIGMAGVDAVGVARRVQGIGDGASSSEDGDAVGGTDAAGDDDSTFASGSQETLILAVYIVVGCGVATLVMLCIVRKVMDLCLLRNDISGRLRYSQEEGLSKQSIERLPQMKYKLPASKGPKGATAAAARKPQPQDAQAQQLQQGGNALEASSDAALERQAEGPVSAGGDRGAGGVDGGAGGGSVDGSGKVQDRDSTEDMCAICLIDYEPGDVIRIIPGCRHKFHKECIDPWLETKAVCAYCKAKVEPKKSLWDRMFKSASDRLGIHLVTVQDPTPHHFSSSRRTYTSEEVRQMMGGPSLPAAYHQQNDLDYVGSMVAPRPGAAGAAGGAIGGAAGAAGAAVGPGAGEGGVPTAAPGGVGRSRSVVIGPEEPQGAIVVQPVSAPSFTVVPREFVLGGSSETGSGAASDIDAGASSTAATLGNGSIVSAAGSGVIFRAVGGGLSVTGEEGSLVAGGVEEEKKETAEVMVVTPEGKEESEEDDDESKGAESEEEKREGAVMGDGHATGAGGSGISGEAPHGLTMNVAQRSVASAGEQQLDKREMTAAFGGAAEMSSVASTDTQTEEIKQPESPKSGKIKEAATVNIGVDSAAVVVGRPGPQNDAGDDTADEVRRGVLAEEESDGIPVGDE